MLSSTEYDYIHDLLVNFYNNGYTNYFCITNNPTDYNSNNTYDVFCYVSKDSILNENNHFTLTTGKKLSFDSNNYSTNNTIDKLKVENINSSTSILENKQEFIYTNVADYADILGEYRTSLNNHIDINFALVIPCLIILLFISNYLNWEKIVCNNGLHEMKSVDEIHEVLYSKVLKKMK